ncbi:MAG: DUF3800 domain-containing protein [Patescibacteria group bacterium]|nr:DUF3800 domain-containing protein [Patescibacteria group bacterium]
MLYKVFIDDSGKKEYKNPYSKDFIAHPPPFEKYEEFWRDNYFVLCGVRIKQEDLKIINSEINQLKKEYFGTHRVEIKSDWLRNPHKRKRRYLIPFKISPERLNEFGEKFIDLIGLYKEQLKILAVVFDKRFYGDNKRQKAEGKPLLKTAQVLFERVQYSAGYNIVIFDQMESSLKLSKGDHDKILNVFQKNCGMEKIFVDKYDKIIDIKFMRSCDENFLQVADICAYNVFHQFVKFGRDWTGKTKSKEGKATMNFYPYFDRIRCNFLYAPSNMQVRGIGLTCIPDIDKINWDLLEGCFDDKKTSH